MVQFSVDDQLNSVPDWFHKFSNKPIMFEEIRIKYIHPGLKPGLQNIRNVWLLHSFPVKFTAILHRGNLVFIPIAIGTVSGKRISYATLKRD